jgi:cell wall-associated NlpC family hydrolase
MPPFVSSTATVRTRPGRLLAHRGTARAAWLTAACLLAPVAAGTAVAEPTAPAPTSGGATFEPPPPPPEKATLVDGRVIAPVSAPLRIQRVIAAANQIVEKPYVYGGGHKAYSLARRLDRGYDCSGAVSFALHGGGFLRSPLPSGALMKWGQSGPGTWITVYTSPGHAYVVIAGLRFDTSMHDTNAPGPRTGPRWSKTLRRSKAFVARHPRGY